MMQFNVINRVDLEKEREILLSFLNSIDPVELSDQVLQTMDWGSKDPISRALDVLKERASQW